MEVILLARGQLNRAFRQRGLFPPDPLPIERMEGVDPLDVDDPAGRGIERAEDCFGAAYADWSAGLPHQLVSPVLAILANALAALRDDAHADAAARTAIEDACDYLLQQVHR